MLATLLLAVGDAAKAPAHFILRAYAGDLDVISLNVEVVPADLAPTFLAEGLEGETPITWRHLEVIAAAESIAIDVFGHRLVMTIPVRKTSGLATSD